jgi:putative hydrolase of the HAD superfamily
MGPACLAVYEEVPAVLRALKHAGMRLAVISDWQKGLPHFVEELGLAGYFDAVVASAEVGYQKPDPRLFEEARARLRVPARETLHVGDLPEDIEGARAAGFSAVFLARQGQPPAIEAPVITDLRGLLPMI